MTWVKLPLPFLSQVGPLCQLLIMEMVVDECGALAEWCLAEED